MNKVSSHSDSKVDDFHNEYLNTSDMLANSLRKELNLRPNRKKDVNLKEAEVVEEKEFMNEIFASNDFSENSIATIMEVKEDLIKLYGDISKNKALSSSIERCIKKLESIEKECGVTVESFDPVKNMSGLKTVPALENADRVIENTSRYYNLFGISSIKSYVNRERPVISLSIFGESENIGFEVNGEISAVIDFNGNEAIDYIYTDKGGILTVKARENGIWQDVSGNYDLDFKIKRYKLTEIEDAYSLFLGSKIISEGKDKLIEALNLKDKNVKFGKCRIFSEDKGIIESINKVVRVNNNE